jgi:hypothetical protein
MQNIPMASVPFQEWVDACANGTMRTNLDRTFKLEDAGKAHEYMEANKVRSPRVHLIVCYKVLPF